MRESAIELYLHRQVTKAKGTTRKWVSPGRKNVPDRIVIWPPSKGRVFRDYAEIHFVELKAPGKEARPGQVREHTRLKRLGCTVLVLDTTNKIDDYVRTHRT